VPPEKQQIPRRPKCGLARDDNEKKGLPGGAALRILRRDGLAPPGSSPGSDVRTPAESIRLPKPGMRNSCSVN